MSELEAMLRDARPEPGERLLRAVSERFHLDSGRTHSDSVWLRPRARAGLSLGLAAAAVALVATFSGLSLAAGGADQVAHLFNRVTKAQAPKPAAKSPSDDQDEEECGSLAHKIREINIDPDNPNVNEPKNGTKTIDFSLELPKKSDGTVSVHFSTQDGTATAGVDYSGTSGDVSFPAGKKKETVSVTILSDSFVQEKEYFFINFTASNASLSPSNSQIKITIDNGDQ